MEVCAGTKLLASDAEGKEVGFALQETKFDGEGILEGEPYCGRFVETKGGGLRRRNRR